MATPSWITEMFRTIDTMDATKFASFLTDDAELRYANMPTVSGREAIEEAIAGFFQTIGGLSHKLVRCWVEPDSAICELLVTYTRKDTGAKVTVPAATIFYLVGEKVQRYLIYNDLTPVYAPA